MTNRPTTTLFMLMSVDGKISTGSIDERDFDRDLPLIKGVAEGLGQYYALEQKTDFFSLNTGRVLAKVGVNEAKDAAKTPVSFIVIDNEPHLTETGVDHLLQKSKKLFIVTTNKSHPAFNRAEVDNLQLIHYENRIDLPNLFHKLKESYGIDAITIQSGGSLNAELLRVGLIDHLSIVVAPCLVGGRGTSSLIDGESIITVEDLAKIKPLALKKCNMLDNSYVHLRYDVLN